MTYNIALFEVSLSFHSMSILFSADYEENLLLVKNLRTTFLYYCVRAFSSSILAWLD